MNFKQLASRLTGVSIPIFGVSWNPPEPEITRAERIIAFMEDRRVLFNPCSWEEPDHCVDSVIQIRTFLTNELQTLKRDNEIARRLSTLRAACRKFLDTLQRHGIGGRREMSRGMFSEFTFAAALGELRGVFGFQLLLLAQSYGLNVEDDLVTIFPFQDDPKLEGRKG
jgi:hypothetical protein